MGVVTAGVNTVTGYLHGQSQEQLAQTVYGIGSTALDQRAAQSVNTAESPYGPAAGTGGGTGGTGGPTGIGVVQPPVPSQGTPPAQGMSSTAKWGIGLGLAAAVGYGVWSMNKSSSGKRRG